MKSIEDYIDTNGRDKINGVKEEVLLQPRIRKMVKEITNSG